MRHAFPTAIALAAMFFGAAAALAQSYPIVGSEPGQGSFNGPRHCVLVKLTRDRAHCPADKPFLKICGANGANSDRSRVCVRG